MTNIDGSYKYVCAICEQIFCDLSTKLDHVHGKHNEGEGAKKIVNYLSLFVESHFRQIA